jgi:hypothetical protein
MSLEAACKKQEQCEVVIQHFFASGIYAREMYLPKGVLIVGKIHKFDNICIISKGKVRVVTDQGTEVLEAPTTLIGKAGVKRVILALEDTVWTTFHTSIDDDLVKIEEHHIAPSYADFELSQEKQHVMVNHSGGGNNSRIDSSQSNGE